jgi:hypothetical protein
VKSRWWLLLSYCLIFIGLGLTAINLYGLTRSLTPDAIALEHLRFKDKDVRMSKAAFQTNIAKQQHETDADYAARQTIAIAQTMAHVHWGAYPSQQFNQLIPIWENYILHLMGLFSGIPEFERYHYTSINKSLERGIGVCGDVSMMLSQILDQAGIKNQLITFPGHVMVEVDFGSHKQLYDPDFGLVLPKGSLYYQKHSTDFRQAYVDAGFVNDAEDFLAAGIQQKIQYWNGVSHFISKKYYFEKLSYVLKWLLPVLLLAFGMYIQYKFKKIKAVAV